MNDIHVPAPTQRCNSEPRPVEEIDSVVIRFAGDSGDGMQLAGTEFSKSVAQAGHAFSTHQEFPSEIRAPTGTLFGVSGYQIKFSSQPVFTSGDAPDVLVAMNPAALKINLTDLKRGGMIIVNSDAFGAEGLALAGYTTSPLDDDSLDGYRVHPIAITSLTAKAAAPSGVNRKEAGRCKNYFALGLVFNLFSRPIEREETEVRAKFAGTPALAEANVSALLAGYAYADATELFITAYRMRAAELTPGRYRSVTGNQAMALGLVAASELAGVPLFLGSYPITPATDILHELARLRHYDVTTFQAEDEIAGICSALGAAYGGSLAVTTTSGPGMALKTEALGLAVMLELPLVVINVQRAGPSTGMPTRIEQADLQQALYGRNGECPLPVIAASSPADCFDCALEAMRLSVRYMTPVILLSDGGIANAAEPWRIPRVEDLPSLPVHFHTQAEGFAPYGRNGHLARPWVRPGTPGLEHRVGGLEKDCLSGNISQDPQNHQRMVDTRAAKVARIADGLPPLQASGPSSGELLVIGWGGTHGAIARACERARSEGRRVANVHLRHLNPLPRDLGGLIGRYERVLVPELNMGQLARVLRERYLIDVDQLNKVQGTPLKVADVLERIEALCAGVPQ
jgi:2-oxoglutarate ferredoxin oxidoreductase subunit alpha